MRRLVVLLLLAGFVLQAWASKRVSVAQLEQTLSAAHGSPDAAVAQQLSGLELTERLSPARFARLKADLPGEKAREALTLLADSSAFLDLPVAEIPATPTPDPAAQRQMMALVVAYVTKTVHQLPNFFATRNTTRFEERPQEYEQQGKSLIGYQPLHPVGRSSDTVLYRDGREVVDSGTVKGKKPAPAAQSLNEWGVFGPILSTVIVDAAQSELAWGHWDQGAGGSQAVFRYAVPKEKSHFWVNYCCIPGENGAGPMSPFHQIAGYRGEISVDPATGTILRLTVRAELKPTDPIVEADIMVEYGPVEIGGKTYICPVRSVSLSRALSLRPLGTEVGYVGSISAAGPRKKLLNDVAFEQYHLFRADARVLNENNSEHDKTSFVSSPEGETPSSPQSAPAAITDFPKAADNSASPASQPAVELAPPTVPAEPEFSVEAANGIPDVPGNAAAAQPGGFVLKMTSRLVDVGVVVDNKGRAVKGLKPDDFEVYDNGRKQEIKFFSEFVGGGAATAGSSTVVAVASERTFSNQPASGVGSVTGVATTAPSTEANATILLIDESHIAWGDLTHARQEVIRFLNGLAPGERVGLYTITGLEPVINLA